MSKKIRKNASKQLEKIFSNVKNTVVYTLSNCFDGEEVKKENVGDIGDWLRKEFTRFRGDLTQTNDFGNYNLRIHSNLWYEFKSVNV